jgi:5-methylcytosine-specific restriction endonuclease McrA
MKQRPRPCIGNGTRPCAKRALANVGSRCRQCRSEYNISLGSSSQRGYSHRGRWGSLREEILERDAFTCHWCAGPANSVDHVTLKAAGGTDDPFNLVAACGRCNSARNQSQLVRVPSKQARVPSKYLGTPANPKGPQQIERAFDSAPSK